jgi:hypothetical protein
MTSETRRGLGILCVGIGVAAAASCATEVPSGEQKDVDWATPWKDCAARQAGFRVVCTGGAPDEATARVRLIDGIEGTYKDEDNALREWIARIEYSRLREFQVIDGEPRYEPSTRDLGDYVTIFGLEDWSLESEPATACVNGLMNDGVTGTAERELCALPRPTPTEAVAALNLSLRDGCVHSERAPSSREDAIAMFGDAYATSDSLWVQRGDIEEVFGEPTFVKSDTGVHGCAIVTVAPRY